MTVDYHPIIRSQYIHHTALPPSASRNLGRQLPTLPTQLRRPWTIVVHNRDRPKIYENPLIERTITGLMGHIEKRT